MSNTMHQLSYSNDLFFKYTLSREDEGSVYARNTIIERVTGIKVKESTVQNSNLDPGTIGKKRIILDVHVKDEKGRFFNLEMQTTYAGVAEMMRFEFYGARALNNQLDSSEKYKDLKPVYQIIFIDEYAWNNRNLINQYQMRNEQGEKAQQCSFDQQLIAGKLGTVGFLHLPQAGGGLEITQVVGSQPRRQQQPPALERKQVFFGAKVLRTAQKLQLKDDILIFHPPPLCLPQGVEGAGRKNKDIPLVGRAGHRTHLHQPRAPLDKDQLHALLPVECHLRKISRNGAGIQIEGEPHGTVLLGFLQ